MPLMSLGVHGKFSCLASWEVGLIEQLTGSTSKRCFWYIREKHVKYTLGGFLPKLGCFCLFGTNFATWSESDWRNQKSGVPQHCSFIPQLHLKVTFPVFGWRTQTKKKFTVWFCPQRCYIMLYLQLLYPFVTVICLNRNSGVLVHGSLLSIPLYPSEVNIFFVRSWRWMNVSSLSLDDNSMDVVMEKGTLDSLQEKSRDRAGCLCYLASPCNKSDFDHVPYMNHY